MRLIDADAIKLYYGGLVHIPYDDFMGIANYFMNQIKEMPTVNPEPHWIPVDQALPEQDEICLVCGKNGGIYVARFWRNETIVLWTKTGTGKFVNAVAWMPLPEPYKGVTK